MVDYLRTSDPLKVFDLDDVIRLFQKYVEDGTGEVMQAVGKFRGKPQAQLERIAE